MLVALVFRFCGKEVQACSYFFDMTDDSDDGDGSSGVKERSTKVAYHADAAVTSFEAGAGHAATLNGAAGAAATAATSAAGVVSHVSCCFVICQADLVSVKHILK